MKFLSPAFVFIHSEEVFMFAQSLHPVYTHTANRRITDPPRAKQSINV